LPPTPFLAPPVVMRAARKVLAGAAEGKSYTLGFESSLM